MSRIIIVRHGNTFDPGDIVTRVGGRTDLALTASGRAQAEALARHFAERGERFGRAFCSPLRRTRETAEIVLAGSAQLEVLEFLREIDYGPDENKPEAEVLSRIGEAALQAWERDGVAPSGWIVDPAALVQGWRKLFVRLGAMQGASLVVTSNGIARFALDAADMRGRFSPKLRTGAYGTLVLDGAGAARAIDWDVRP